MKMDGVADLVNGTGLSSPVDTPTVPSAVDIGRVFIKAYYTMLSESPVELHKFYSHESYFNHNDVEAVGQIKIKKALEENKDFEECKVRIHTIKGSPTLASGIALQVCGELSTKSAVGRRFTQTFVLCQQTPKKFYVQNDIFQFYDKVFGDVLIPAEQPQPVVAAPAPAPVTTPKLKEKPLNNGHAQASSQQPPKEKEAKKTPSKDKENVPSNGEKAERPPKEKTPATKKEAAPKKEESKKAEKENEPALVEKPVVAAPVAPPPAPKPAAPKTWANLVSGGAPSNAVVTTITKSAPAPTPAPKQQPVPQATLPKAPVGDKDNNFDRKIYLGNITRNKVPSTTQIAEAEIKAAFQKFGNVESVAIPRKVVEAPEESRPAFAFITMQSITDAQNVFKAARKEGEIHHVSLKLETFGFDGEATISVQKPSGGVGSFRGGRGGFNGGGFRGGAPGSRGGAGGRGGRGGARATNN